MNLNPGGKQARMRDGWYRGPDGVCVRQLIVFPADHPEYPNKPKGMKHVLQEHRLWRQGLLMKCKLGCDNDTTDCCAFRMLKHQPDFQEQQSLVRETIEAAGHLCIFLLKIHCELNFIKFFWGAVKMHLRENCDYSFDDLDAKSAQLKVRVFSSRKYKSHRRIPEVVARSFDI